MSWAEITVRVDPVAAEAVCARLFDLGCTGVVTEEFPDSGVRAYFPQGPNVDSLRAELEAFLDRLPELFPGISRPAVSVNTLQEQDWSRGWRRFFKPLEVTPTLWVVPPWEPVPEEAKGSCVIFMDPGPAFGTGGHESTRLCLRAMEGLLLPPQWRMMDVGTGSGILAIYGAMKGARAVEAIDVDPGALAWAEKNLRLNPHTERISLSLRPIETYEETFHLVAANLLLGVILDIMPRLARILSPQGRLILSGLLRGQEQPVLEQSAGLGLKRLETLVEGEWVCLVLGHELVGGPSGG